MSNVRKILIVDDDAELRDALVEQLGLHEEFESVAVDTGTKGVQAAKAGQIDLVIMDVGLPDIDGREAVRILRKNGTDLQTSGSSTRSASRPAKRRRCRSSSPRTLSASGIGSVRSEKGERKVRNLGMSMKQKRGRRGVLRLSYTSRG